MLIILASDVYLVHPLVVDFEFNFSYSSTFSSYFLCLPVRAVHLQEEVGDVDHSTKRLPATNLMSMMLRAIVKVLLVMTMMVMVLVDNVDGGGVGDGVGVVGHHAARQDPVYGLRLQLRVQHRPLT